MEKTKNVILSATDAGFDLTKKKDECKIIIHRCPRIFGSEIFSIEYYFRNDLTGCEFGATLEQAVKACKCFPLNVKIMSKMPVQLWGQVPQIDQEYLQELENN